RTWPRAPQETKRVHSFVHASIDGGLHAFRCGSIVFWTADRALADSGEYRSGRWQRFALDPRFRVPEPGTHDRLRALEIDAIHGDHNDAARHFAGKNEAFAQCRID